MMKEEQKVWEKMPFDVFAACWREKSSLGLDHASLMTGLSFAATKIFKTNNRLFSDEKIMKHTLTTHNLQQTTNSSND